MHRGRTQDHQEHPPVAGNLEQSWEQIRVTRMFIKENTEKWQELASAETRRLEREEKKLRMEMIKRRKEKFGKIGGKKLTVIEEAIIRNQTKKLSEMIEIEQNVGREQSRRQGKKLQRLEQETIPEGRTRSELDKKTTEKAEDTTADMQKREENHWRRLLTHKIKTDEVWMTASRMENSSLEEKRMLAYDRGKDGKSSYSSNEDQAVVKKIPVMKKGDEKIEEEEKCSHKAGRCQKAGNLGNELSASTFCEEQAGNLDGQGSERGTRKTDALMYRKVDNQEERTRTSQVEDIVHTEEKLLPTDITTDKVVVLAPGLILKPWLGCCSSSTPPLVSDEVQREMQETAGKIV